MRTTPFDDIDRLFDRMNRRLAALDEGVGDVGRWEGGLARLTGPSVDVADYGEELVVVADLPGFEKSDIDLSVGEDALTVRAERETDESAESDVYVRRERSSRSVSRTVPLPAAVDADAASASYVNGVLTVTLPKLDTDESSHRIDID